MLIGRLPRSPNSFLGRIDGSSLDHEFLVMLSASSHRTISTSLIDLRLFILFLIPLNINFEPFGALISVFNILKFTSDSHGLLGRVVGENN